MSLVRCVCKSHCRQFNPVTLSFEGDGALVSKSTAYNHRLDDQMTEGLDNFAGNVAARVLKSSPPIELLERSPTERVPDEEVVLETELMYRCTWTPTDQPLAFISIPSPDCKYQYPAPNKIHLCNRGTYALEPGNRANDVYLENESRLCEILLHLRRLPPTETRERLESKVREGLVRMRRHKEMEWNRHRKCSIARQHGYAVVDTSTCPWALISHTSFPSIKAMKGPYFRTSLPTNPILSTSLLTILLLHLFFRTPRRATAVMIAGIHSILLASQVSKQIIDQLPKDPRTIVDKLDLDPRTISYLQCPACYALYSYQGTGDFIHSDNLNHHCTHRPTPESDPCGTPLWKERRIGSRTVKAPCRKYVHQSLKEWIARLLARPGVEEVLDVPNDPHTSDRMSDIWDSPVFRGFRDTDGTRFFAKHGDDARFAFSLGADSFHPLGSLEVKQVMSATAIFMVLLNFPKDQRFKYKNMYLVGVIPGPSKPSLEQINHALVLLVKELLEFWKGVYFTRTARFRNGRFAKGAMIPLVCDMLAAWQVAGFGSVTSMFFCTFCLLAIQDIENLRKETWPERTIHNHLECARSWRDCRNERDRDRLFRLHGIRWSALLDLPYWNPILFTILDSMHAAFLGLFQTHCRKVWGIDVSVEGGDGTILHPKKAVPRPSDSALRDCLLLIHENPPDLLEKLTAANMPKNVLWHVCVDHGLRHAGARRALAKGIVEWVSLLLPLSPTLIDTLSEISNPRRAGHSSR